MSLPTSRYRNLIRACAEVAGLPPWGAVPAATWLEAQVLTESGGDPRATRYERHLDANPGDDGTSEDAKSYGLLQVLGSNIRHQWGVSKFDHMDFGAALRPIMGMAVGVRHLAGLLEETHGDVARALARYNGGGLGDQPTVPGGPWRCSEYVARVAGWALKVQDDIAKEGKS